MHRFLLILLLLPVLIPTSGCRTSDGLRRSYLERLEEILPAPKRPVIIIPGLGVSRLYDPIDGRWVWGAPRTMVITSYEDDLDLPLSNDGEIGVDRLEPQGFAGSRGSVNTAWQLAVALEKFGGYRVARWNRQPGRPPTAYLFEYDWRRSAFDAAERLDALIDQIRTENGDPDLQVDLLTHSAGANVAIAYLQSGGERSPMGRTPTIASSKVARLVMVAPPRRGTLEAFRLLVRGEKVIRRRLTPSMAATWPSITEVLPHDGAFLVDSHGVVREADLRHIETWRSLQLGIFDPRIADEIRNAEGEEGWKRRIGAFQRSLLHAETIRKIMHEPFPDRIRTFTILGDCVPTVRRVLVRPDRSFVFYEHELREAEQALAAELFAPGDGTVAASSATALNGEGEVRLCSGHQGLSMDPAAQRAILRALLE